MDPFDEFEFTPLTEGLGFHKKAEKLKHDIKASNLGRDSSFGRDSNLDRDLGRELKPGREKTSRSLSEESLESLISPRALLHVPPAEKGERELGGREVVPRSAAQSISDLIASLPPSLDFIEDGAKDAVLKDAALEPPLGSIGAALGGGGSASLSEAFESRPPQIFQPLGRDEYKPSSMASPLVPVVSTPMGQSTSSSPALSSPYRERLDESFARAFPHAEKSHKRESDMETEELRATAAHLVAPILDGMVAAGISTILLVAILAITRINLIGMLANAQTDGATQLNLALLFLGVVMMYMLTARSFFGASLGEWAFDLQLGTDEEQRSPWFPVRVALRAVIVTVTGIVPLPLLSALVGHDLLRPVTGLQLYRRS